MIFFKYLFIYFISLLGSEMLLKVQASSGKFGSLEMQNIRIKVETKYLRIFIVFPIV